MLIVALQSSVSAKGVAVEHRTSLDVFLDDGLHGHLEAIIHNLCTNLPAPLNESHDGNFVILYASSDSATLCAHMHVPRLTANVGFVNFNFATTPAKLGTKEIILQGETDAV